MKKTVVYISSCATDPEGRPDFFMLQELTWLRSHFDRVLMCGRYGIAEITEDRPEKVAVARPIFRGLLACLQAPLQKQFWQEITYLRKDGRWNIQNALKVLMFIIRGLKLYYWIQAKIRKDEQTTAYAFWMSYDGFAAALCKQKNPGIRAIARGHAFDIDIQRNSLNPYLMKRFMIRVLDSIYPINNAAKDQIAAYVEVPYEKLKVVGVGSVGEKAEKHLSAPRFTDGIYRVVSCAVMVDIKQIPLLIDVLAQWNKGRLHWVHIGGGKKESMIRTHAEEKLDFLPMITYELTGTLQPEQVRRLYETKPFDVFINTSKIEGTPVAIMEALHAGLPVVAPMVGGIPELIDDSIGCLYPKDGSMDDIIFALETIYEKTAEDMEQMRAAAQTRWNEQCLLSSLLPKLFPEVANDGAAE